jgi:hypothetical protein
LTAVAGVTHWVGGSWINPEASQFIKVKSLSLLEIQPLFLHDASIVLNHGNDTIAK